jgi:hypothetical protein
VDDRLARSGDATGAIHIGVVRQAIRRVGYGLAEPFGGVRSARGDIVDEVAKVLTRLGAPDQREHQGRLCLPMIVRISAMT